MAYVRVKTRLLCIIVLIGVGQREETFKLHDKMKSIKIENKSSVISKIQYRIRPGVDLEVLNEGANLYVSIF